ncbi:MAG: restriction endonuclease subunit S [Anaerolineales bacterium]|nr:restriction endonuclease subunit S [Anaerolineales bacterium]
MDYIPLNEVAKFINGRAFKPSEWEDKGLPIIRIQNLTRTSDAFNYFSGNFDERYRVKDGDILISWSASLGVYIWQGEDAILNQHIFRVETNGKVDKTYFFYAAQSVLDEMKAEVHGATMQHITKDRFEALKIPLPPIEEQQRIAGILARADRLWQLRRYALQLSEGYLQSVFLQMFGDPVTNPMGWEIRPLGKLLTTIDTGVIPVCQERPALDNEWGILKLGAVTTCNYLETENKAITSKTSPRMELEVKSGDLLFSRKNTYDLVGACAYVHHTRLKLMLPDLIFRLQIEDKKELDPIYLWQLLIFPTKRKMVQRLAGGSAGSMPNISKGRLNTVEIPLPSPELQSKFACVVRQAERLRAQQHEAARQAEHLFATLLHRAFTPSP